MHLRRIITTMILSTLCISSSERILIQTDWSGGPGVLEPVETWEDCFENSQNINYSYQSGSILLTAVLKEDMSPEFNTIGGLSSIKEKQLEAADLDNDGDIDLVVAGDNDIRWYENDGNGGFSGYTEIYTAMGVTYLGYDLEDFDADGDIDIIFGDNGNHQIRLYMNDGNAGFTEHTIVGMSSGYHVAAEDYDGDGDIDAVSTPFRTSNDPLYWFENQGNNTDFHRYTVEEHGIGPERGINSGDLDGDGDVDFLTSFENGSFWYENQIQQEGANPGFTRHFLDAQYNLYDWIGDINQDGYNDILTADLYDLKPTWWENNGSGEFSRHELPDGVDHPEAVLSMDVDYDGDVDIVQAFWNYGNGGELAWYENDGNENFTYKTFTLYAYACDLQVADISGNGLLDLIASRHNPGIGIDWLEIFDHFEEQGELTSCIFDAQNPSIWQNIEWVEDSSEDTHVKFLIRTGNDPAGLPDWDACDTISSNGDLSSLLNQETQYLQYKTILQTSDFDYSPSLYEVSITYDDGTGIAEKSKIQPDLYLSNNHIHFTLPDQACATLSVFDVTGRCVFTEPVEGSGRTDFDMLTPSGIYFVRLERASGIISQRMVLTR